MIVIKLIGGLGNQLFQYAAARALAKATGKKVILEISEFDTYKVHDYALHHFNLPQRFYTAPNLLQRLLRKMRNVIFYKEPSFQYDPELPALRGDILYLEGYFQSERYFSAIADTLREDLRVVSPLKKQTIEALGKIEGCNAVSLHVRRGDYLQHPIHNTDKEAYYRAAIDCIRETIDDPVFFVFSDDIEWAKHNVRTSHPIHFIDFNDAASNYEDLVLMSSCKHNIIANSSFSWWGAWLNENPGKTVVAPIRWFADDSRDYSDVVPNEWIKF